jgi:hypothetical protein
MCREATNNITKTANKVTIKVVIKEILTIKEANNKGDINNSKIKMMEAIPNLMLFWRP